MTDNREFTVITLPSGVRCVHRRSDSPVAYLSLNIGAGTRDEHTQEQGVAHLVEHMLFKGTTNHRSYYINSALDSVGGELNAFTSKEETVLHATCAVEYVQKGAALLCDMVFHSLFDSKELEKEKEVVIDEINSYKDSPSELIFDEFEELLFEGSSLGRNILGDKRSVKRLKSEDLQRFCKNNYRTDNMVFALSSSLSDKQFKGLCERVFANLPQREPVVSSRIKTKPVERFEVVRKKRVAQLHAVIGGYAPSLFSGDRLVAALLINIIGGPSALSRMNMTLREKYGITYNAEAAYCPFSDSGLYTLYFSCDSSRKERAEQLLFKELAVFTAGIISEAKLSRYKRQFIGQLLIANQSAEGAMMAVAKSLLLYGGCESTSSIVAKINAISTADIHRVASMMFAPENIYKLIYQ